MTSTWETGPGVVELPDGRRVRVRGLRHPVPPGPAPQLGVYLVGVRPPGIPWPSRWVRWRDFRVPTDTCEAVTALVEAWDRSGTERVEIACRGGVGRTGTALAVLAVLGGLEPDAAVTWVRVHHHPRAIETPWQRRWVRTAASAIDRPG